MMAKEKEEQKSVKTIKIPRINPWMISTIVLLIILAVFLVREWRTTGKVTEVLTAEEAANKAVDYINKYLLQGQGKATLISFSEEEGLCYAKIQISGRTYDTYITMDGKLLFPSAIDLTETAEIPTQEPEKFEPKKTDKPVAQLFVMSFCPYGQQAEKAMKPVVDLLGNKASIEPHFIVSVSGDTINSLHGEYEATEDMRQACIWKYYGQATFWNYVDYINNNCNRGNLDTCWRDAANNAKVDAGKIENCVKTEGLTLMKAEESLSEKYSVTGSPTLIINDARYSGERTQEAFKQAICNAFTTQPNECSKTLSTSSGSTSSGGC